MAHGVGEVVSEHTSGMKVIQSNHNQQTNNQHGSQQQNASHRKNVGVMGSRRIFAAAFKLKVLDSYRNDIDCRGNQRATARKYGIHRRQIQKWLQCEDNLRSSCAEGNSTTTVTSTGCCDVPVVTNNGVSASSIANDQIDGPLKMDPAATSSISTLSTPSSSSSSSLSSSSSASSNGHIASCNVISPISPGTPIGAPALAGTAAPALNLSLTRLHGDEQQQQQHRRQAAPPPHHHSVSPGTPMRHSIRRDPSPLQYLQHNNNDHNHHHHHHQQHHYQEAPSPPVCSSRVVHGSYDNGNHQESLEQSQRHPRHIRRQQTDEQRQIEELGQEAPTRSPERKYSSYVSNRPNYEHDVFTGSLPHSTNTDGYYRNLESYRKKVGYESNQDNNDVKEIGAIDASFTSHREKKVNEAGNVASLEHARTASFPSSSSSSSSSSSPSSTISTSSSLMALHATTIKSERASPDSLASPSGPCETPGSPESTATIPRYHNEQQHRPSNHQLTVGTTSSRDTLDVCTTNTRRPERVAVANAAATVPAAIAAVAVHSSNESTRLPAHVHIGVGSQHPEPRLSEKWEREHRYGGDGVKVEYNERVRGTRVKEERGEVDEPEAMIGNVLGASSPTASKITIMRMTGEFKRETSEERAIPEDSRYNRESIIGPVYQALPPTPTSLPLMSSPSSGPVSPRDSIGTYCGLSSPRAASSSGISTSSSCSDSEIDPLDYSSTSTRNPISDLSRRRSFSLRFKLDVLDAFHSDIGVAGNQRATARKFGINRRQVQKWLGQESELRGEIALRGGDLRQRLGPINEINNEVNSSSAVDLRTSSSTTSSVSGTRSDVDIDNSSSPLYCCDSDLASQKFAYYRRGSLVESSDLTSSRNCTLSCCADNFSGNSSACYRETASQRRSSSGYPESQGSLYCYSPRDSSENEVIDVTVSTSPLKRAASPLNCYYYMPWSPKRLCSDSLDKIRSSPICQDQDVPLCLVKPKESFEAPPPTQMESVTSTVPTPPAPIISSQPTIASSTTNKRDAILFKPYLDNPVSKPTEETQPNFYNKHGGLSPSSAQNVNINNNNNNCQDICNLNKDRNVVNQQHDYSLELSLRLPVSWNPHTAYGEFPERLRSAFVRYPTSPHYT